MERSYLNDRVPNASCRLTVFLRIYKAIIMAFSGTLFIFVKITFHTTAH